MQFLAGLGNGAIWCLEHAPFLRHFMVATFGHPVAVDCALALLGALLGLVLVFGFLGSLAVSGYPNASSERHLVLPLTALPTIVFVSLGAYFALLTVFYATLVGYGLMRGYPACRLRVETFLRTFDPYEGINRNRWFAFLATL